MEKRVLIAIVLCIVVLVLWEKFFIPKRKPAVPTTSPEIEKNHPCAGEARHGKPTATSVAC
jgi:hypothetical protein